MKERDEQYQRLSLRQGAKLLRLFEQGKGRPAKTIEEVEEWVSSPEGMKACAQDTDKDGNIIPD
jgi:hypothetical protein